MERWDVGLNNNSFDGAGITRDCQEAICELIWNGYEAQATKIDVVLEGDALKESPVLHIIDNGTGINHNTIKQTFGKFLSSEKRGLSLRIKSRSNKGKGRFSYFALSDEAQWTTRYQDNEKLLQYSIQLITTDRAGVRESEIVDVTGEEKTTGTTVSIPITDEKTKENIQFHKIKQQLLEEFVWYLYLRRDIHVELDYLGNTLDSSEYINDNLSRQLTIEIDGHTFIIDVIVWKSRINNSSKIYYMTTNGEIEETENTSFNKNSADFYHGVFVRSEYFSTLPVLINAEDESFVENATGQKSIMRELKKKIRNLLDSTFHDYLVAQADVYIEKKESQNQLPHFADDDFGKCKKKDFINVTREIYCAEPRLFTKLKDIQAKTLFNFIALLLDSNERENLLSIMEQIVSLTTEQRERFTQLLKRTQLSHVIDLLNIIETRLEVIGELKKIVYDQDVSRFANERDHIQRIVENHYWLFGDQYALVSADVTIKKTLQKFEAELQTKNEKETALSDEELRQRMDIVLYGSRTTEANQKEGLVVELKAPSVPLDYQVLSQIERYANIVRKEPQFSGSNRIWKFYAVCSRVDDDVKARYEGYHSEGKLGLASVIGNFEVYTLSWDDVFLSFENRYRFMLEKIQKDFEESGEEEPEGSIDREYVNKKVESLISRSAS